VRISAAAAKAPTDKDAGIRSTFPHVGHAHE